MPLDVLGYRSKVPPKLTFLLAQVAKGFNLGNIKLKAPEEDLLPLSSDGEVGINPGFST